MRLITFYILSIMLWAGSASAQFNVIAVASSTPNGVTLNTFLAVQQTATATATPATVNLLSNVDEAVTLNSNAIGIIQAANKSITLTSTAASALRVLNGSTLPVTVKNITFSSQSSSSTVAFATLGVGFTFFGQNFNSIATGVASAFAINVVPVVANQFVIDRALLMCTGTSNSGEGALKTNALAVTVGGIKFTNTVLKCSTQPAFVNPTAVTTNKFILFDHCGFFDSATGISTKGGEGVTNCLFLGNTTDFLSTGAGGVTTDLVTCGFGQLASGATSSFYGMTKARSFCDQTNYFIGPQDNNLNNGTSSLNGTTSFNGLPWVAGFQSFGPNAYDLALCGGYGVGK